MDKVYPPDNEKLFQKITEIYHTKELHKQPHQVILQATKPSQFMLSIAKKTNKS